MFAVPAPTARTAPTLFTVATSSLSEVHVISLLLALSGTIVTVRLCWSPSVRESDVSLIVMPATGMLVTVISQVSVLPPSAVVTVIVAVPPPTAVSRPLETVTTSSSLEDQVTRLLEALAGCTVAERVWVSPTMSSPSGSPLIVTPVTGTSSSSSSPVLPVLPLLPLLPSSPRSPQAARLNAITKHSMSATRMRPSLFNVFCTLSSSLKKIT